MASKPTGRKSAVSNPELLEALQQVSCQLERTHNSSKFELVQRLTDNIDRSMRDIVDRRTAAQLGEAIARRQLRDRLLHPQLHRDVAEGMAAVEEGTARRAQRLEVLRENLESLGRRLDASLDRVARLKKPQRLGVTPGDGGRVDDRPARQVTPELARSLRMEPSHVKEWVEGSGVDPAIVALNVRSLSEDVAFSFVLYSDKLDRTNTGRLTARWLKQYDHLYEGGWWVSGIDPDDPYHPMTWGRFKPDKPRVELRNGKARAIKYENPPQEETRAVFLNVPRDVLKQVARRYDLPVPLGSVAFWQWVKENNVPVVVGGRGEEGGGVAVVGLCGGGSAGSLERYEGG